MLTQGMLYPLSGRVGGSRGHHNIAWQISGDRRFNRKAGDIDTLLSEIANHEGDVILSSEDFESSMGHRPHWEQFINQARRLSRRVVFIVYLRSALDYIQSLYREMLRHGFGDAFERYVENALAVGKIRIEDWEFYFDYARFLDLLLNLGDVDIVCRNYHSLLSGNAVLDIFSVINLRYDENKSNIERINHGDSLSRSLHFFYANRVRRALVPSEMAVIDFITSSSHLEVKASGFLRRRILNRFKQSTADACNVSRLKLEDSLVYESETLSGTPILSMQRVFSPQTQYLIQDMATEAAVQSSRHLNAAQKEVCLQTIAEWIGYED